MNNNNATNHALQENMMVAFQERAQQITREHVEMLQLIYKKDHSGIERRKMFFEQHYMFLKEELTDLQKQLMKNAIAGEGKSTHPEEDKLTEIQERYLMYFRDNCDPKGNTDQN